jgi:hypothetical protein
MRVAATTVMAITIGRHCQPSDRRDAFLRAVMGGDRDRGWKPSQGVLSCAGAIRAHPVHGKGTSHLSRIADEE